LGNALRYCLKAFSLTDLLAIVEATNSDYCDLTIIIVIDNSDYSDLTIIIVIDNSNYSDLTITVVIDNNLAPCEALVRFVLLPVSSARASLAYGYA